LAVTPFDIALIWGGGSCVLVVLIFFWQSLFASTINHELAQAEGMKPEQANIIFMLLMSAVIAIAMKIVGVLLITSMLIFPAAIARRFANGPEQMAFLAVIIGIIAVFGGLFGSLQWDTPAGPSIVVAASAFFIVTILPATSLQMLKSSQLDKPKAK